MTQIICRKWSRESHRKKLFKLKEVQTRKARKLVRIRTDRGVRGCQIGFGDEMEDQLGRADQRPWLPCHPTLLYLLRPDAALMGCSIIYTEIGSLKHVPSHIWATLPVRPLGPFPDLTHTRYPTAGRLEVFEAAESPIDCSLRSLWLPHGIGLRGLRVYPWLFSNAI